MVIDADEEARKRKAGIKPVVRQEGGGPMDYLYDRMIAPAADAWNTNTAHADKLGAQGLHAQSAGAQARAGLAAAGAPTIGAFHMGRDAVRGVGEFGKGLLGLSDEAAKPPAMPAPQLGREADGAVWRGTDAPSQASSGPGRQDATSTQAAPGAPAAARAIAPQAATPASGGLDGVIYAQRDPKTGQMAFSGRNVKEGAPYVGDAQWEQRSASAGTAQAPSLGMSPVSAQGAAALQERLAQYAQHSNAQREIGALRQQQADAGRLFAPGVHVLPSSSPGLMSPAELQSYAQRKGVEHTPLGMRLNDAREDRSLRHAEAMARLQQDGAYQQGQLALGQAGHAITAQRNAQDGAYQMGRLDLDRATAAQGAEKHQAEMRDRSGIEAQRSRLMDPKSTPEERASAELNLRLLSGRDLAAPEWSMHTGEGADGQRQNLLYERRSGDVRPAYYEGQPIYDASGKLVAVVKNGQPQPVQA